MVGFSVHNGDSNSLLHAKVDYWSIMGYSNSLLHTKVLSDDIITCMSVFLCSCNIVGVTFALYVQESRDIGEIYWSCTPHYR